jgi:DNA-binding NarL/FixJ family response regulator
VLLVDDQALVRMSLERILTCYPELRVVGQASNGEEAVAMAHQLQPDLILMDYSMPKMNGVAATRLIASALPSISIIGLSFNTEKEVVEAFGAAGAVDFVDKQQASTRLYPAILAVLNRTLPFSSSRLPSAQTAD